MKKIWKYLLAFIIPVLLFWIGYFLLGCTIQGENILVSDMKGQYISLYTYFQNVLKGTESLFYSFSKGLGGGMIATFAYYLASPINLLIFFFSKSDLPIAILLILTIKIGLSGFTMYLYLNSQNEKQNMNLIFSTMYAFMGYVINYYFHIMWLDAVYLLPLVLLGIDRFIHKNKKELYLCTLPIAILSNFYTGYMICIFAVLYFFTQLFLQKKKFLSKTTLHFVICSILSTGLCAFILLPTLTELKNVYRSPVENLWDVKVIWNHFIGVFGKLYIGSQNCKNILNATGANVYIGTLPILLLYFYFRNTKIERREKKWVLGIILFFIVSFTFPILIYIWHGFSLPNYFNNRNAFLVSFILITISARSYAKLEKFQLRNTIPFWVGYGIISLLLIWSHPIYLHTEEILLTTLFLMIDCLFLYLITRNHKKYKIFLAGFVILELILNFHFTFITADNTTSYQDTISLCSKIKKTTGRIELSDAYSGLDSILCETSSITSFLSTNTLEAYQFMKKVGYPSTGVTQVNTQNNTIVMDSVLGMKIYETRNPVFYYQIVETGKTNKENFMIATNPYALEIGYVVEKVPILENNTFENQNTIVKSFSGILENPLEKIIEINQSKTKYEIASNPGEVLYVQIQYQKNDTLKREVARVKVDGEELSEWVEHGVFQVQTKSNQVTIEVEPIGSTKVLGIEAYRFNQSIFAKQIQKLKQYELKLYQKEKNKLSGSITSEGGIFFLTLPYDTGFEILVDGKKQEYSKALDYLIQFDISSGTHIIEITYTPNNWKLGVIFSIMSFILIFLYLRCVKK